MTGTYTECYECAEKMGYPTLLHKTDLSIVAMENAIWCNSFYTQNNIIPQDKSTNKDEAYHGRWLLNYKASIKNDIKQRLYPKVTDILLPELLKLANHEETSNNLIKCYCDFYINNAKFPNSKSQDRAEAKLGFNFNATRKADRYSSNHEISIKILGFDVFKLNGTKKNVIRLIHDAIEEYNDKKGYPTNHRSSNKQTRSLCEKIRGVRNGNPDTLKFAKEFATKLGHPDLFECHGRKNQMIRTEKVGLARLQKSFKLHTKTGKFPPWNTKFGRWRNMMIYKETIFPSWQALVEEYGHPNFFKRKS